MWQTDIFPLTYGQLGVQYLAKGHFNMRIKAGIEPPTPWLNSDWVYHLNYSYHLSAFLTA